MEMEIHLGFLRGISFAAALNAAETKTKTPADTYGKIRKID